jgi:predicted SAM-dependent methyltransferase
VNPNLEIGPAGAPLGPDWDTLDIAGRPGMTYYARWGEDKLPIPDGRYSLVYACHVIEHIPWYQTDYALREAFRILKPGGIIELHTVDFAKVVELWRDGKTDNWDTEGLNIDMHPTRWAAARLINYGYMNGQIANWNWHRALFDLPFLSHCLFKAGFQPISRLNKPRGNVDHGVINLGIHAFKPSEAR